jgi:4-hydroxy-3-methylbut-2-enyl diphosphate reductase
MDMEVRMAKTAGFCFGVKRALEMVRDALRDNDGRLYCLGPLIHNPRVVAELSGRGVLEVRDIDEIPDGTDGKVIIRSHGAGPGTYQRAMTKNLEIIDATCPFVKNVQRLGAFLAEQGYQVVVFGEKDHAEVQGVLESIASVNTTPPVLVIGDHEPVDFLKLDHKVGIISQTTQDSLNFSKLTSDVVPHVKELRVFNTICSATTERQKEAAELSREVDVMVVVGGKNSANTFRLAEITRKQGTRTYLVESPTEINPEWFRGVATIGITAGASTPDEQIDEIVQKIKNLGG